jgi:transcriptional regulator with XRE-family HTH domain
MSDSPTVHDPDELRLRRIMAGLNQGDLAERTGLSQSYISLLERGVKKKPTAKTLGILADALGCDIGDLMPPRPRLRPRPKTAVAAVPRASAGRAA